ncbi:VOC family protein [Kamptonema animale CS-326]|jgi:predicted enzyme related to lactoylglutathione lyase|uniref:VOC family protein n=1 Tax=Kamptonema animale TaxID=92934 RepID=UPI00232A8FE3|nr:VOC family protein [Kamptonema animale]MDB9510875.1 VOC family protein [Kamptonema animale CS-326]
MVFDYTSALVTLADLNSEALVQFYTKLLGQEPRFYIQNVYAEFDLHGLRLGIFKPKDSSSLEFANQLRTSISLCLEVSDLESAIAHLTALGYGPSGEILTASHGREIYAYDPAGNRLILHQSH